MSAFDYEASQLVQRVIGTANPRTLQEVLGQGGLHVSWWICVSIMLNVLEGMVNSGTESMLDHQWISLLWPGVIHDDNRP